MDRCGRVPCPCFDTIKRGRRPAKEVEPIRDRSDGQSCSRGRCRSQHRALAPGVANGPPESASDVRVPATGNQLRVDAHQMASTRVRPQHQRSGAQPTRLYPSGRLGGTGRIEPQLDGPPEGLNGTPGPLRPDDQPPSCAMSSRSHPGDEPPTPANHHSTTPTPAPPPHTGTPLDTSTDAPSGTPSPGLTPESGVHQTGSNSTSAGDTLRAGHP